MDARQNFHLRHFAGDGVASPSPGAFRGGFDSLYDTRLAHRFRDEDSIMTAGLAELERRVGPMHRDVAELAQELARLHYEDENVKKALYLYDRAWRIWREVDGKAGAHTLVCQQELAMCLHRDRQHMRADALLDSAMRGMDDVAERYARAEKEERRLRKKAHKHGEETRAAETLRKMRVPVVAARDETRSPARRPARTAATSGASARASDPTRPVAAWGPPPPRRRSPTRPRRPLASANDATATATAKAGARETSEALVARVEEKVERLNEALATSRAAVPAAEERSRSPKRDASRGTGTGTGAGTGTGTGTGRRPWRCGGVTQTRYGRGPASARGSNPFAYGSTAPTRYQR